MGPPKRWLEHNRLIQSVIDDMPEDLRMLVYEYGYDGVVPFLNAGITDPWQIERMIRRVLKARREI